MRVSIFLVFFFQCSCFALAPDTAPQGKTLQECYEAALQRSELVATQGELIKQAEETYHMAISAVLPNVQGAGTYQFQQKVPASFGQLYPNPSTLSKIMVTQPLFQGFKEFAGLRQTKTLIGASQYDKKQAATQLYIDVATSYHTVASYEQDIDNINEELRYFDKRIAELNQFVKIGRSQVTDVLTVETQKAALKAQMHQIQGQWRAQRAVLSFLTGFDSNFLVERPTGEGEAARPLETYLTRVTSRGDFMADQARAHATDEGVVIARAGHLPTAGVQGDYYLERTGALSQIAWDVLFTVSVPIFSGGLVQSQVQQAVAKRNQAELQLSRTKRLAEQQIRQYYESYLGDKKQFEGYSEATDLAEKNYKAQSRNYRLGLVTNLDVLMALTTFQESKRSKDKAYFSMLSDVANLEAAGTFRPDLPNKP